MTCTPPDIRNIATSAIENLLPQKSRHKYECVYERFLKWRAEKNTTFFSENIILSYFVMLAEKYSSSSLWSYYSMLKSTLVIRHDIHIENYKKLQAFLKRKSKTYKPKKSKTLSSENIKEFIEKAPDEKYLVTKVKNTNCYIQIIKYLHFFKVAVIMGIMGACRSQELHAMKLEHIDD
ncbi:hypothetical protein TcasGA2_TC004165 [Tribolium castaneum]|uniref:Tyr recombinase domain-containing protein n=1 Tax=Tribolium castaneum TaxID=7070 RepID=D7EM09_TRICA|nr:hypothetical protein TcasGA2_TC004165 [Tribolium castaneum]